MLLRCRYFDRDRIRGTTNLSLGQPSVVTRLHVDTTRWYPTGVRGQRCAEQRSSPELCIVLCGSGDFEFLSHHAALH